MTKNKKLPLVVIFGRTNVGKSTLFNTLSEKRKALISDLEGTTRDSNIGIVEWRGASIEIVDTGGIMDLQYLLEKKEKTDDIEAKVQKQARDYLKRADLILFLVDAHSGIIPQDRQLATMVKKVLPNSDNIILVVNKADTLALKKDLGDYYRLGFGEPIAISATVGSGTGDLLDVIIKRLKIRIKKSVRTNKGAADEKKLVVGAGILAPINLCIIGRPNAGKSSLLNSILGEERVIVSPVAHTTREPQDTIINYKDRIIKIVDTAGISKKGKRGLGLNIKKIRNEEDLIKGGIAKSLKALDKSDIALFVIDVNGQLTHGDQQTMEEIVERKKSVIIVANKWDTVPLKDTKKYTEYIYDNFPFVRWAVIQFTSALTGEKVNKLLDAAIKISEERNREITDSQLNTFMMRLVKIHRPSKGKGAKNPRVHKFIQTRTNPPIFEIRIGSREDLHFSYVRFIENRLREKFGFLGTPITIKVTKKKAVHGSHNI